MSDTASRRRDPLRVLITTLSVQDYQNYVRFMQFARRLVQRGHHVTLVTTNPRRAVRARLEMIDGVRVMVMPGIVPWRLRRGALAPLDIVGRVVHALRERYDLVHCDSHRPATMLQALTAHTARRTPWICEWVDLFGREGVAGARTGLTRLVTGVVETRWEERAYLMADGVIAISRGLYERALGIGVPRERLTYIPGGSDVERMPPRTVQEARQKIGLAPEIPIVGVTGYEKADRDDMALVLKACAMLRSQFPDLHLLVTGKAELDQELVTRLGVEDMLLRPGWLPVEEYPLWLSAVNVFALPFRNTMRNISKWPMKMGDYMAVGRPVVSNPTGDMISLFDEYNVGLLVEESAEGFRDGLATFLADPDRARQVGLDARQVAEKSLSWDVLTGRLEATYYALLGRGPWPTGTDIQM